jgi:hypothetical protein
MFVISIQNLMRTSGFRGNWFVIAGLIFIFGCAKVSVPTGGPKDTEIPVVVKSTPANGAINVTDNEITVTFNEYVVLDKINEKFMVSPPMKTRPEVYIRGKDVHVRYEDQLRDSTTYTFYFQDAIRDLNENNAINNYQFVFSTGSFIDSLSVTGNVWTALNLDPPENTMIMLHRQLEDSAVVKEIPDYITRASAKGEFRIDNVHSGIYRLYALIDADNSKNYNNRDEFFAFYDTVIKVSPENNYLPIIADSLPAQITKPTGDTKSFVPPVTGEYQLTLFQAEKKMYYLTSSSRKMPYQFIYTLSLPPDTMDLKLSIPEVPLESFFVEKNKTRDTVTVWITDSTIYNRQEIETLITFPFTDTLGITSYKTDTIQMRYITPRAVRGTRSKPSAYKVSSNISGQVRPDNKIILTASTPFMKPDTSLIFLFEVLKEQKTKQPFTLIEDTTNSCRYYFNTDLKPGSSYLFVTDSAAFHNIYGESSDSTGLRFSVRTLESFGNLKLEITGYKESKIIQLLDNSEKILRQSFMDGIGSLEFPLLDKGRYRVRAIFDINNDRKWSTGDFNIHLQPEPVSYYPEEIEIIENWDHVELWELEGKNYKEAQLQKIKTLGR